VTQRQQRGAHAEERAAIHLERQGLQIVARNFRCRMGEIDLVARDGPMLVFVEVRLRASGAYGGAQGSVDWRKQARVVAAARYYLSRLQSEPPCRFDVVTFEDAFAESPQWLQGAFEVA
jgi:putative endonuclease